MGCGASARSPPPKDDGTSVEPESGTWATQTLSPSAKQALGTEVETFTSPKGGSLASNKQAVIVLDADEDEDGIEVIYETAPKIRPQPAAANGQEPPEAAEEPRRPEPKPMPKKQVEEAAKLSETRKRFDNNRYQKQRTAGSSPEPFDMPGFVNTGPEVPQRPAEPVASTKGYPGPQNVAPAREAQKPSGPKTDMMFGLNVTESGPKDTGDPFGCLPGGIFDELEDLQQPIVDTKSKNRENQHNEVKSNGFDDDDEMLMKEILENFDA